MSNLNLQQNLIIAASNNVTLTEIIIMNTLNHAKLIVDDIFFCDEEEAWYADISRDGEIFLGKDLGEAFDESFDLSLESSRCSFCNHFTILVDDNCNPLCGECGETEDDGDDE